jgi:hypothetical protein
VIKILLKVWYLSADSKHQPAKMLVFDEVIIVLFYFFYFQHALLSRIDGLGQWFIHIFDCIGLKDQILEFCNIGDLS